MKEFFGFGGYQRAAEGFMSWQHLLFVSILNAIMLIAAVALGRRLYGASLAKRNRVLAIAAISADAVEIFKIVIMCIANSDPLRWLHELPLFMCSVQLIAMPIAPFMVGFAVKDPLALSYGSLRFRIIIAGCILNMLSDIFIAQSRGLGNSFTPMLISIGTVCVFRTIYLNTVYPYFESYLSIILVFPITYLLNTILQSVFYIRTRKKIGIELAARKAAQELMEATE